jgi:hypothetical protein
VVPAIVPQLVPHQFHMLLRLNALLAHFTLQPSASLVPPDT